MRAILLLSILVSGCASTSNRGLLHEDIDVISTYKHPSYGEIKGDDARLKSDRDVCRNEVYNEGVMVDGKLVKDYVTLNKIESDYQFTFIKEQLLTNSKMPSEDEIVSAAAEHAKKAPPHISEIRKKKKLFDHCIGVTKQYQLIKTEVYNRKTGKIISQKQY
jgi:hypothetical protein